ncbi:DUF4276 family protein [Chloroflexales bacterium ZM16-3]|nr:DUF4276 family protein [Chloroflexales bacterium ZM16-3]
MALAVEGPTDERFFQPLLQRTADDLLRQRGIGTTDVLDPVVRRFPPDIATQAEGILWLAQQFAGSQALAIHMDADAPSVERAMRERYTPGLLLVEAARAAGTDVCRHLIPLIPVRMLESWMLADGLTLCAIIGTDEDTQSLGLPAVPHQVERIPEPKRVLAEAVRQAFGTNRRRQRRAHDLSQIHESLGRRIRLHQLRRVPSFLTFEAALASAFVELRLIEPER